MRLTRRLLLSSLAVGGVLVLLIAALATHRLEDRLLISATAALELEARHLASVWHPDMDADSLADAWAAALGSRVTLLARDGRPLGDSDYDRPALERLESFADRPEVRAAAAGSSASVRRGGAPTGDEQLFVAVLAPQGIVRLAQPTSALDEILTGARTDILLGGIVALTVAMLLAAMFARAISRPIVELRDVAQAFAAGDVTRRPTLVAPGEIGDLATALYRMAGQLGARLEALQQEEALLLALIESLNEGIVAVNPRGRIVRLNESGRRLLGIRANAELTVDHLPRDRVLREALDAALAGNATPATELRVGDRTLLLTARALPDRSAVLALYDLTPVRRLEAVRRDFVANVSHELKTPLTVVSGFAETLTDEGLPDAQRRQFAETIRANARRMQRIVDDLLDLSRIESGGWIPAPMRLDAASVAADALAPLADAAAAKGVEIQVVIDPRAGELHADPTAVRQILGNLIENAVRYTPSGGRVTIFTERRDDGVRLGVRDTGIGIPADHLPRIFERFYRVDPARSRDAGGTGLGLAIVRHLAEAHGGRVRAESTPGGGTSITASFPDASEP